MHACTLFLITEMLVLDVVSLRIAQGLLRTEITFRAWRLYQVFIQIACTSRIARKFQFDRARWLSPTSYLWLKSNINGFWRPLTSILCLDIQICWNVLSGTLQIPSRALFHWVNVAIPFSTKACHWSFLYVQVWVSLLSEFIYLRDFTQWIMFAKFT